MHARWLVIGLGLLLTAAAGAGASASDKPAETPAQAVASDEAGEQIVAPKATKKSKKKRAEKKTGKKAAKKVEKDAEKKPDEQAESKAAHAKLTVEEPKSMAVEKLPGALKSVHVCAMPNATVEVDSERYAKSVMFFVSCTAAKGGLTPFAVYMARDNKATGAKPVAFEGLKPDGTADKLDMLYSVTPAREAFTKEGETQINRHTRSDKVWVVGAWAPDDRPGVCAISAQWRIEGDKGELFLWEEAKECPKDALPRYEAKIDKKPPALVGR